MLKPSFFGITAKGASALLFDAFDMTHAAICYYIDNVHLTLAGYALIADAVRDAIEADL